MNECIFKTTRRGNRRVVMGPTSLVTAGATITVEGVEVTIKSVGKTFERKGAECCYGYGDFPAAPADDEVAQLKAQLAAQGAQLAALLKALSAEPVADAAE